jgi:hypothetical protein
MFHDLGTFNGHSEAKTSNVVIYLAHDGRRFIKFFTADNAEIAEKIKAEGDKINKLFSILNNSPLRSIELGEINSCWPRIEVHSFVNQIQNHHAPGEPGCRDFHPK